MSLTSAYERMVRRNGHPITLTRIVPITSLNLMTIGENAGSTLIGYSHVDAQGFGALNPLTINFHTVMNFVVSSSDVMGLSIGYPLGDSKMDNADTVAVNVPGYSGPVTLTWDDGTEEYLGDAVGLFAHLQANLGAEMGIRFQYQATVTVPLTAKSVREREEGIAGSAMQSSLTFRIIDSEIAATTLIRPRSKDKIIHNTNEQKTVNKVEAIEGNDVEIVGWRLRVSG